MPPVSPLQVTAAREVLAGGAETPEALTGATREFESMLLHQLMTVMRRTVPQGMFGGGMDSQIWSSMLDQTLASNMAEAGGIGLADMLAAQLRTSVEGAGDEAHGGEGLNALRVLRASRAYSAPYSIGHRATGALGRIQEAAVDLLAPGRAEVWGREGQLGPQDLTNDHVTVTEEGVEGFNVLDANGFEGYYKCNLFAFELAYRGGLRVPVIGRGRGWGYPGPNGVAAQIERGQMDGRWAVTADAATDEQLARAREDGVAFMLVGEGREGRHGHMGLVDEVHRIDRDREGHITRVEYSGWEANGDGAHYRRRVWGTGRFASIHLLELRAPAPGEPQVVPMGAGPALPSLHDAARHSTPTTETTGVAQPLADERVAATAETRALSGAERGR